MPDGYKTEIGGRGAQPMDNRPPAEAKSAEAELLSRMRDQAIICADLWKRNHARAEESVDFVEGLNHWPQELIDARQGQPCLTLNDMPVFVARIAGEQLQNKQSIHIHPDDGLGAEYQFVTEKGEKKAAALVREGLVRNIEYRSNAESHYDRAHHHAVDGGIGWLRVLTRYASPSSFDQEIIISSVRNRWSVVLDTADTQEPDLSDARMGFVFSSMRRRHFETQYPKAMVGALADLPEHHRAMWGAEDVVPIAEYFCREPMERDLLLLSTGQAGFADDLKSNITSGGALVDADGAPVLTDGKPIVVMRRRPVIDWCVYWRKVTAWSILEGGKNGLKLPFTTIPLVPVFGRVSDMRDGTLLASSAIHHAMDSKRMEEYWMSSATGRVALAPLSPFVGDARAFEGYQSTWARANRDALGYLPYNGGADPTNPIPPPQRMDPPSMPIAELAIVGQMHDRAKAAIGVFDASLGAQSNETSGRAINARDRQSSTSTYVFGENLRKAIRRVGILTNEAISVVYDTERRERLHNEDGTGEFVTLNRAGQDADGQPAVVNSLRVGSFGVVVQAGPSYITQREESREAQLAIMQAAPQTVPIMLDTFAEASDWPGSDKVAYRAKKMLDPNLLSPAEKDELAEADGQQDDPQTGQPGGGQADPAAAMAEQQMAMQMQVLEAQTQAELATANAKVAEADAKIAKAKADIMEAELRMAALKMGGQPQPLPAVGGTTNGQGPNQEQTSA